MPACSHHEGPQAEFDRLHQDLIHGDLKECEAQAEAASRRYLDDPEWSWQFRVLQAEAVLWEGFYDESLKLIDSGGTPASGAAVPALTLAGQANAYLHRFPDAGARITQAERLCSSVPHPGCGDVIQARGILLSQQGSFAMAEKNFQLSLAFARSHGNPFLEATSLLNMGEMSIEQGRYDEAVDRSSEANQKALQLHARIVELVAQGNVAWALYKLGDFDSSLKLTTEAERLAASLQDFSDQGNELTNLGYLYMDQRQPERAAQSFQQALRLATKTSARQDEYNALRVLARLSLKQGDTDAALRYANRALDIAKEKQKQEEQDQKDPGHPPNHLDELYPTLVLGQVAASRGYTAEAQQTLDSVENDPDCPVFLRWEAQHSLARLYESENRPDRADTEYRTALATFESARSSVGQLDFKLSFLTNAASIYDDYIHFLVAQGKSDDALRWADQSRALTLAERLGLLTKMDTLHTAPPPLNPRDISHRAEGALLFYWLGENQSYLWAITPQQTSRFPLPPAAEIDALVHRYHDAIQGPQDMFESPEGRALYEVLVAPAQPLLASNSRVFIIPDGSLNNLNFETLIVANPKPHFWIEDARVVNVSSLRVLSASLKRVGGNKRRLLLIGDSVAVSKEYSELPHAAQQMAEVARHFADNQRLLYQHEKATPAAYLNSDAGTFSYIHFVAHGTSSPLSPLDSAIVLSRPSPDSDEFKLYARDIVQHRLRADLVTISACYGAGERAYSGEGLVGLAWAFLSAGAHNVVAGLWEVSDDSTEQLMARFYDELNKGSSPGEALRIAKLSLLHGERFQKPFYWAPFQLYTGS